MRHLLIFLGILLGILSLTPVKANAQPNNQAVKEWTFLIYLNGDNSLDSYGPYNINEMEKVGSTDRVNVVVQWASTSLGKTQRLLVKKDNDINNVTSPIIQDMGQVDMGDYNTLIDFVKWGVANYPAQHYFINVWDHGGGWHFQSLALTPFAFNGGAPVQVTPTDISWDDGSNHFITTKELGIAIQAASKIIGHKVDIYASDACLMAMPEVAAEMADAVQIYAGSEETEPSEGWPYDILLTQWNALPTASASEVAKVLTDTYVSSYQNGSHGTSDVTFSAFDMSQFSQLSQAVNKLGGSLAALDANSKLQVVKAIDSTQTFNYKDYGDLVDFTNQLGQKNIGIQPSDLQAVQAAVGNFVIESKVTSKYKNAHGVSIWLPANANTFSNYWAKYNQLVFEQMTHWGSSIKSVLGIN